MTRWPTTTPRRSPTIWPFYRRSELESVLGARGFAIELAEERSALLHEHQGRRIYLLARRT